MQRRRRSSALTAGLVASALLHLMVFLLDPRLPATRFRLVPRPPELYTPSLPPVTFDDPVPQVQPATQPPPGPGPGIRPVVIAPDTAGVHAAPVTQPRDASVAERLEYRPGSLWAPSPVVYETEEECRRREINEAVERGIADPRRGNIRLPTDPEPSRRFEAGVRITVGPRRDPPPVGIRAPTLPDSVRTVRPHGEALYRYGSPPAPLRRPPGCGEPGAAPRLAPRDSVDAP